VPGPGGRPWPPGSGTWRPGWGWWGSGTWASPCSSLRSGCLALRRRTGARFVYQYSFPVLESLMTGAKEGLVRAHGSRRDRRSRAPRSRVAPPASRPRLAVSEEMRRRLIGQGVAPDRVMVFPLGSDLPRAPSKRQVERLREELSSVRFRGRRSRVTWGIGHRLGPVFGQLAHEGRGVPGPGSARGGDAHPQPGGADRRKRVHRALRGGTLRRGRGGAAGRPAGGQADGGGAEGTCGSTGRTSGWPGRWRPATWPWCPRADRESPPARG